jgi:hypothetical protein
MDMTVKELLHVIVYLKYQSTERRKKTEIFKGDGPSNLQMQP